MIKTIIFDLDGVLIDSKDVHYHALNAALPSEFRITPEEHLGTYDGLPTRKKLALLTLNKGLPESSHHDIALAKSQRTSEVLYKMLRPIKEYTKIFKTLKCLGYRIAMASNAVKLTVDTALKCLELTEYFDAVYSNQDVANPKPHFEMYFRIMLDMDSKPCETLVLEDSHIGRQAVLDAGCHLLPVLNPQCLKLNTILEAIEQIDHRNTTKIPWRNPKMNVLIPMAGAGSRFTSAGYSFPKPLVEVGNKPMIQVVTENLNIDAHHIYIVQKEHYERYNLETVLNLIKPGCSILQVEGVTEGAACTTLLAKHLINTDAPLIIANSDQFIEWNSNEALYAFSTEGVDGGVLTFSSTHPKWSYAEKDDNGFITRVAEKNPISTHATVGVYYFKKGSDYVECAEEMIQRDIRTNNEFYVCPVFNQLIERGGKVRAKEIQKMWGLGTPEDLGFFIKDYSGAY